MTALVPALPSAPAAFPNQRVIGEARRLRHEWAWTIELPDGRRAVLAQLVPELASDPALRRRWVADMERVAALPAASLAPTLAIGPLPDPRAVDAEPPWRVRLDPPGESLDQILKRAPLPVDEVVELGARLALAVQTFHAAGAILRDLDPRSVVIAQGGAIWFTDVGHARLAILSSRTASSLLLESSPYVAAEAMLGTVVDARADVYSLGVVLWRALTGRVPFEASLLSTRTALPDLTKVRREVPPALAALVVQCLAHEPEQRPPTARDVADALRGKSRSTALAVVARLDCQACGAPMRVGLRLCLACGREAVQYRRTESGDPDGVIITLDKAKEDAVFVGKLQDFFRRVGDRVPSLNFVTGDRRMYSKAELAHRHALPTPLMGDIEGESGKALVARLQKNGFKVSSTTPRALQRQKRTAGGIALGSIAGTVLSIVLLASGTTAGLALGLLAMMTFAVLGIAFWARNRRIKRQLAKMPIGALRAAPAALPAGDPLVAAIAKALVAASSPDVKARLEEIALLVQRLVDAKGDADPVGPIVKLATETAAALESIDHQLASLDEGAMVRALTRSEARHEAPALRVDLLAGLDTLRKLEETRGLLFGRLLEITSLARTVIERGLGDAAALRSDDIEVAHALAALD